MAVRRKFDARHEFIASFAEHINSSTGTRQSTIIPIIMNDDAQGDPMSFKAHPEHASWSEVAYANCYPDSEIKNMKIIVEFLVPKALSAITSVVRVNYALISCAFPEDLDAIDEKSGLSMKEVLELQKESTDRQCYPLWNAVDMLSASTMHANIPGLTGGQLLEAVAFDPEVFKDQMRYGRIKGLLKKCTPIGYRSLFIRGRTVAGYTKRITFNFTPSNAKFINPYTFLGILIRISNATATNVLDPQHDQPILLTDVTSNVENVVCSVHVQYDERNPEFHMGKV